MDGREDHHGIIVLNTVDSLGQLAGVDIGNLLVHVKEVAVTLTNLVETQALNALAEVEEHGQTGVVHAEALVATLLGSTRCHVTRHEVAECGIAALEVVVTILLGNLVTLLGSCLQCLGILQLLGHPDTAVVAQ